MKVLLDTGPWVAFIDRSESKHLPCVEWLRRFDGEFYTSEAVLTEVLYLLNFSWAAQSAALDFILQGVVNLVPSSRESLKTVQGLMRKYGDLPMDFADGTLVSLSSDLGILHILTFDQHFSVYRPAGRQHFTVLP